MGKVDVSNILEVHNFLENIGASIWLSWRYIKGTRKGGGDSQGLMTTVEIQKQDGWNFIQVLRRAYVSYGDLWNWTNKPTFGIKSFIVVVVVVLFNLHSNQSLHCSHNNHLISCKFCWYWNRRMISFDLITCYYFFLIMTSYIAFFYMNALKFCLIDRSCWWWLSFYYECFWHWLQYCFNNNCYFISVRWLWLLVTDACL